jgi:hypothetical protein
VGDLEGGAAYDEHGNPIAIDQGRLRLKTKRFSAQPPNQQQQEHQQQQQQQQELQVLSTYGIPTTRKIPDGDGDGNRADLCLEEGGGDLVNAGIVDPENTIAIDSSNEIDIENLDVPDNTCSICLCELEEGDWVGDIPCGHLFHKDCLKEWLVKNNHCPICRMTEIATHPVVAAANVRHEPQEQAAEPGV